MEAVAHRQQPHRRNPAHPSREPIEPIEPIDGVGDANQPDHRDQQAQPIGQMHRRQPAVHVSKRKFDRADAHTLNPHQRRHPQLQGKAGPGRQGDQVIGQANQKETERPGQGCPDQLIVAGG